MTITGDEGVFTKRAWTIWSQPSRHSSLVPDEIYGNLSYKERLLFKQWDHAENCGVVAQLRCTHANGSPRSPCVLLNVVLDKRNNGVGALHHSTAENQQLRIES